jgi:hypothetical protein
MGIVSKGIGWNAFRNGKKLDVLARKLKLKTNSQQMLATLEKGGIDVRPTFPLVGLEKRTKLWFDPF